ncbi:MAG TPA: ATP-binding protein [Parafilimonas sp.]|nr:ATP-binding protein [Parafilimonas sp.]
MSLQFVIVIIIVTYLRRAFKTKETMPLWHKRLMTFMFIAIGCMVLQVSVKPVFVVMDFVGDILVAALLYIIYKLEEFKSAKFLFVAILPYVVASFLDQLVKIAIPDPHGKWSTVTDSAKTFTVIWGFGVWFVTRKQQKELAKARAKAFEEEKNNIVISEMKSQLEVQVAERTAELRKQKEELEHALDELRSTQAQLIQSEKMASLGELTAGIAHEIQNPLNFVNNFSEVNNELIEELRCERQKGEERDIEIENDILNDITQNNTKISFHGRRADAIVKSMLQHSRKSTGQKEATDINELCDEYLRLSYHGLRAKDKSFNVDFKTDFDNSIGKMDIVPQDIGRVLLNLFNNAFYAVNEKKKSAGEDYHPMVMVTTKSAHGEEGDEVLITVKDNGNGIPQNIVDKIFQPFFTTKPTGSGTGLGLSLAYDIIKAHGGELKVNTTEGEGSEFTIQLPV